MDVEAFEDWWSHRERGDIEWMIDALAAATDTADGEIERLRASREVTRLLRRAGRHREALEATHRVRLCALEACAATGVRERDPAGATLVARAAGDAAACRAAGEEAPCCAPLLRPFLGASIPSAA